MTIGRLFFDKNDYRLLEILSDVLTREHDHACIKTLLTPYLRPHGIKELAASPGLRIAYAIVHLLNSLKSNQAQDRIKALAALRDEVFASSGDSLRYNRARVLIQIAKELIRARGNHHRQLELAHDFRAVAHGKSQFLRSQLRKYHLLEMPEQWNQIAFDDRVHDANSKGRKSATHLIMDAWVKGIRSLTVVYYNNVDPAVVSELFAAAQILDIEAKVGIEFRALYRDRFVKLIWSPSRLEGEADIRAFFQRKEIQDLLEDGWLAQQRHTNYVVAVIDLFNRTHIKSIAQEFGVQLSPVTFEDLAQAVQCGQPSLLHLGTFIHQQAVPLFQKRLAELKKEYPLASYDRQADIAMQVESMNSLDVDTIVARYLLPSENQELASPDTPEAPENMPPLLRLSPEALAQRLRTVASMSKLTLILMDLHMEDVLEILYDCKGKINAFEVFNIKSMTTSQMLERGPLNELQQALNEQNAVKLKDIIRGCIARVQDHDDPQATLRIQKLRKILNDFDTLRSYYRYSTLKTSIGTGSTGLSSRSVGMGFAVRETLPAAAQRDVGARLRDERVPASASTTQIVEYISPEFSRNFLGRFLRRASKRVLLRSMLCRKVRHWRIDKFQIEKNGDSNLVTLGGIAPEAGNGLDLYEDGASKGNTFSLQYLNGWIVNTLKILIGFIPAFLTFYLTKDWWVQAYLGGVIWFSITGLRNVVQSILGGGGLRRSPYLRWDQYVSWGRIADSLLYTGFSVPLLDWLCKTVLLQEQLGINVTTAPLALYTIMAVTNGIYISSHNLYRGLPFSAAVGNFFRSVLSIPIAVAFSFGIGLLLSLSGVVDVDPVLQLWAAVISKLASDCVAGVIEGLADRNQNIAKRRWDYSQKIKQIFDVFTRLEVMYPNANILRTMQSPKDFIAFCKKEGSEFATIVIANALDMLYMRYYQPRASEALGQALQEMTPQEQKVFVSSQYILGEEREVARLFVEGLVGNEFSKALSFYLLRHRDYVAELNRRLESASR